MGKIVAIIGAGPSGLATAKAALECDLSPIIFEKSSSIGGIWSQDTGSVWRSLSTNISKFTCSFSDFPWSKEAPIFPNQRDVYIYLENYAKKFNLFSYIHFNAIIKKIQKKENCWQVEWSDNNKTELKLVDFVVVATGIFSQPMIPNFQGLENFKGEKIHSINYKSPEKYKEKKALVIGSAFSGIEIAADFATHGQTVIHTFRKPYWIISRNIPVDPNQKMPTLPLDLVFYTRSSVRPSLASVEEVNMRKNAYFSKLCPAQNNPDNDLYIDPNSKDTVRVAISDNYCKDVESKNIITKKSNDLIFLDHGVKFSNGETVPVDVVIFCTGYQLALPFFDNDILTTLSFKNDDQLQPTLLYKATLHPDLKNMAFVGMYRGPYFGVIELQARWSCMIFCNKISAPARDVMTKGIEQELAIRNRVPRPQFPHGEYVEFADGIARDIQVLPDFEKIKKDDPALYKKLWNNPLIPAHYRLEGPNSNRAEALSQIDQLSDYLESQSQVNSNKLPSTSSLLQQTSGTSGIFTNVLISPNRQEVLEEEKLVPTLPSPK